LGQGQLRVSCTHSLPPTAYRATRCARFQACGAAAYEQHKGRPAARAEAASQRRIVEAIMGGGQGAVMAKEALKLMGVLPNATLRLPLVGASSSQISALAATLRAEGLV